jgi:hypothetical protein
MPETLLPGVVGITGARVWVLAGTVVGVTERAGVLAGVAGWRTGVAAGCVKGAARGGVAPAGMG